MIAEIGPERIAALIGEPVLGAGGVLPLPEGYWPAGQELLRRHEILLVLDEVVTAYGRLGHWFGAERFALEPDVIVTAKTLSSGYFPVGAVLVHDRVIELLDGTQFLHAFTGTGHPVGAAVALANLDIIERENLLGRARETGDRMLERLRPALELSGVVEVRSEGLMLALDLDEDVPGRDSWVIYERALERGVIVRVGGSAVTLSPPLVIEPQQADRIVDVLLELLSEAP